MKQVEDKYLDFSNAELKVKLTTMENEYEAIKTKIKKLVARMDELNSEYISMKQVLDKRTRGKI